MQHKRCKRLPAGRFPFPRNTTLQTLELVDDGIPAATNGVMVYDSSVVRINQVLEEKLERCGNVRLIAFGLYEPLPDHRVNLCITLLLHNVVDGLKQWCMTREYCGVNKGRTARESQTHELTNLEKYSVMMFSAVIFCAMSCRAQSCRL